MTRKTRASSVVSAETLNLMGLKGVRGMNPSAKNPNMPPSGSKHPTILILGEAPGKEEDYQGKHFVGHPGRELMKCIPDRWRKKIAYDNVVRTRPPNNRAPEFTEIECFRPSVIADIERLKPKIILGTGAIPLHWVLGQSFSIKQCRGKRFPVKIGNHVCWYYPVHHPSYIILKLQSSKYSEKQEGRLWQDVFKRDLKKMFKDLENLEEPFVVTKEEIDAGIEIFDGNESDHFDRLIKAIKIMAKKKVTGFDYESNFLRPYNEGAKVLAIGIGTKDHAISFAVDHPEAGWKDYEREAILKEYKRYLFSPGKKIAHNLSMELEWSAFLFGDDVIRAARWEDTMQQSYAMDERKGIHSLNFVTLACCGVALKEYNDVDRSRLAIEPVNSVLRYNAMDAKFTHLDYTVQKPLVELQGVKPVYEMQIRRVPTLVAAQRIGIPVHHRRAVRMQKKYARRLKDIDQQIQRLKPVRKYRRRFGKFNPASNKHMEVLFKDILGRREGIKGKRYSTDEEVLNTIIKKGDLTAKKVSRLILELRGITKLKGTYIDPLVRTEKKTVIYPDGRIHTNFNTIRTDTGRLCVAADTLLETSLGKFRIEDLDLTDKSQKFLIRTHEDNWKQITAKWFKGYEEMLRIRFRSGAFIECTAGHQILTRNGWKKAGTFQVGDSATVDPSFKRDGYRYGAASGIRGQQSDHSNSTRGFFHSLLLDSSDTKQTTCQTNRTQFWSNLVYEGVVQTQVYQSAESGFSNQLCFIQNREYAWDASAQGVDSKGRTGGQSLGRVQHSSDCEGIWDYGICGTAQPAASSDRQKEDSSSTFFQDDSRRAGHFRRNLARCSRQDQLSICKTESRESRVNLQSSFHQDDSACPKVKKLRTVNVSKFQFKTGPESVLVLQLGGNGNSTGTLQSENSICEAGVHRRAVSRFCITQKEDGDRGRWGVPRFEDSKNDGSEERQSLQRKGIFCLSSPCPACTKESVKGGGQDIQITQVTSIQRIGVQAVWDITVADDHSYAAQGLFHHNSSDDPNMQNFPKRDEEAKLVRTLIVPPKGMVILAADYSGMEARVIAMRSKDKFLVKALWENYDIHQEWAQKVAKMSPEVFKKRGSDMKAFRDEIKNQLVFPAFFGALPPSIARALETSEPKVVNLFKEFWDTFAGVKDMQEEMYEFYRRHGYIEGLLGRRRHAPLNANKIINTPIQGTASDVVMDAMCRLSEKAHRLGDPHLQPVLNIHDDLSFFVPKDQVKKYQRIIGNEMVKCVFDFVNVPLVISMSVGKNWGRMKDIMKLSSADVK